MKNDITLSISLSLDKGVAVFIRFRLVNPLLAEGFIVVEAEQGQKAIQSGILMPALDLPALCVDLAHLQNLTGYTCKPTFAKEFATLPNGIETAMKPGAHAPFPIALYGC